MKLQEVKDIKNWLYKKVDDSYIFGKRVSLCEGDTEWEECTEEQKVEFETYNQEEIEKELEVVENEEIE